MNIDHVSSFRTRTLEDGSLEVWARGWRLESQFYALIPIGLSLMFLLAPMPLAMRGVGAIVLLVAALFVFRMTKPGLVFAEQAVTIVSVVRRQRFPWEQVSGFMGERRHDEGRVLLVLEGERQVPLPGTLDPSELDPYGDEEGEMLSAVDQLNRLGERAREGDLPKLPAPFVHAPTVGAEPMSRKDRRADRKELRAALKAVRLKSEEPEHDRGDEEAAAPLRRLRRRTSEPAPELTQVTIAEPAPEAETPKPARPVARPSDPSSHFPKPVYIPQAEYAQMLRDQKAAEKAAAAAAAELSKLADLDELAEKEEFSDWTS